MSTVATPVEALRPGRSGVRNERGMAEEPVHITTLRFGGLTVLPRQVITLPKGLLGFESGRRYVILDTPDSEPFRWFQSLDDSTLAFVIVNPLFFFPDYHIDVDRRELDELEIADAAAVVTYVICSVPGGDLSQISANLQGPIVLNTTNNLAKQLVLSNGPYTTRHLILEQSARAASGTPRNPESRTPAG